MLTILLFLIILSVLVVVHEFGHFISARKSGMRVYEFGLGFPPRIGGIYRDPNTKRWVWVKKNRQSTVDSRQSKLANTVGGAEKEQEFPATLYSLNWLPLGGFCKIKGENGEEMTHSDSFGFQKAWKRFIVLVSGVAMNFVLAAILLSVGFIIGLPADFGGGVDSSATVVEPPRVMIQQVEKESPAEAAGLKFGDRVVSMNGEPVDSSEEMALFIREFGHNSIAFVVEREGRQLTYDIQASAKEGESQYRIGAVLADVGIIRYPWHVSLFKGFAAAAIGLVNIFISFYLLLKHLILGQGLVFDVAGPVGIAVMIGESARMGFQYLLNMTAMISLSLAAVNILPIPALDGGRVFFLGVEKLIGKPVSLKYEQVAHTVGFVLLMILVVLVTGRDVLRLL